MAHAGHFPCQCRHVQTYASVRKQHVAPLQMIRELAMDREARALASQTSSVPIWLQDSKPSAQQPSHSPKPPNRLANGNPLRDRRSHKGGHTSKHSAKPHQQHNSSASKAKPNKYMGFIAPRTKPGASSYHDLSLGVCNRALAFLRHFRQHADLCLSMDSSIMQLLSFLMLFCGLCLCCFVPLLCAGRPLPLHAVHMPT